MQVEWVLNNLKAIVAALFLITLLFSRLMAAMEVEESPLEFRKDWVEQVQEMFFHKKPLANTDAVPRVAAAMLKVKPEAYIPQFLSLGPYHHWRLEKDIMDSSSVGASYMNRELKMSTAEASKVKTAAALSKKLLDNGKRLDDIVEMIKRMQQGIEQFYDCKITDANNFALMMAVDSFFLLRFLFGPSHGELDDRSADVDLSPLYVCIKSDILKLENQIPLSVVRGVFEYAKEALFHQEFNEMLQQTYTELSPFEQFDITNDVADVATDQSHLLGCIQAFVSPFLKIQSRGMENGPQRRTLFQRMKRFSDGIIATVCSIFISHPTKKGRRDFLKAYNAGELARSGINFKSFSRSSQRIRFDKNSYTLYLPRITLCHILSEVFLRNMLALEFNDAARSNSVTRYVGLMDCLIDTPDDVRLLRDSHVIRRRSLMLTDQCVADMWNGMCQPFFTGQLEPPEELKLALEEVLITEYYKSQLKKALYEFYLEHLSSPWKVVALLIGFCVLAMTAVQAYCSMTECSIFPRAKSKPRKYNF